MAKISHSDLIDVIGEKTLHITDQKELAMEVAAFLVHENQQIDLASLVRDIMQYRLEHGFVEATAVSAHELPPEVIADVRLLLTEQYPDAKSIVIDTRIDPAVIGGVRIELARQRLDMTVQAKINTFKRLTSVES